MATLRRFAFFFSLQSATLGYFLNSQKTLPFFAVQVNVYLHFWFASNSLLQKNFLLQVSLRQLTLKGVQ